MERLETLAGLRRCLLLSSTSPDRTVLVGSLVGSLVPQGTVISLEGGLGVGKTICAKGLCAGLGVSAEVLSPSFILVEEYKGKFPVLHFDLYRLERLREVADIGLFDSIGGAAVVIVEWGDRLPAGSLEFDVRIILKITGPEEREILIEACDDLLAPLKEGWV
jgi:tRNA threonylcarbamoyladenosine biosynthesis protein TsaE